MQDIGAPFEGKPDCQDVAHSIGHDSAATRPSSSPRTGGVRFAPSPTGRFHVGNLRTAWISRLWAKTLSKPWVVRFEDIDQPRVLPEAQREQLSDMLTLGLEPDVLLVQNDYRIRHWDLFLKGVLQGQIYPCDCSRQEVRTALAELASAPHDGLAPVYSGRCRSLPAERLKQNLTHANGGRDSVAWRFRMPNEDGAEDFIVARTSGAEGVRDWSAEMIEPSFTAAYHWACAIDDLDGGYDLLIRSADLLPAAPLQQSIQRWMIEVEQAVIPLPAIFHTSLVTQNDGRRLEKRTPGVCLVELRQNGLSAQALLDLFQRSFDFSLLNQPIVSASILSEPKPRLTLSELGIT